MANVIVGGLMALLIALAVVKLVKDRRRGGCCGCEGCANRCGRRKPE